MENEIKEEIKKEKKKFTILGVNLWEILAYFIIYSIAGYIIETSFALIRYGVLENEVRINAGYPILQINI